MHATNPTENPIVGILVGGTSRRMGLPKALIEIEGVTLLERTARVARTVAGEVVLLGRPDFALPSSVSSLAVIEDLHPGSGPIGGLEAMLTRRPDAACILLACDMPYLGETLMRRLSNTDDAFDAAVCSTNSAKDASTVRWHPCCGLYRPSALPAVRDAVAAGRLGMTSLLQGLRTQRIALGVGEDRWVENWNTPDDVPPAGVPRDHP